MDDKLLKILKVTHNIKYFKYNIKFNQFTYKIGGYKWNSLKEM